MAGAIRLANFGGVSRSCTRIAGVFHENSDLVRQFKSRLENGTQFLSNTDSTILLIADFDACEIDNIPVKSLEQWRDIIDADRLSDVVGAFTLAWLDDKGCLNLARDAIGERTLFYAYLPGGGFVFASDIKVIIRSRLLPKKLNLAACSVYLTFAYIPSGQTLVDGIAEILPGTTLRFEDGSVTSKRFWQLPAPTNEPLLEDESAACNLLRNTLDAAVRRCLSGGGPIAATLSGGIDSSLVVALARRIHGSAMTVYSISFGKEYPNELEFSSMVAKYCNVKHQVVELSPALVVDCLDSTIAQLSQPIGDPLTVPNRILFKEASVFSPIVLNGEGGDPCFGGPKNLPMLLSELYGSGEDSRVERAQSYLRAHLKCFDELEDMLSPEGKMALKTFPVEDIVLEHLYDQRWPHFLSRLQAMNIMFKGPHHILPKIDQLSFPYGVLPRSPLFDRSVTELAMRLPPKMKQNGSTEKYLLKRVAEGLLPFAIIDRPKSGMLVPVEGWFKGPLKKESRQRLLDTRSLEPIIERSYIERLLAGKLAGLRPRHGVKIWLLITLESWIRNVLNDE